MLPIIFIDANFRTIDSKHDDPIVVTIEVANFVVMKTLIDQGSSADILYWKTFRKMGLSQDVVVSYNEKIVEFSGEREHTRGYIDLYINFGKGNECCKTKAETSYNILLGRPSLNRLGTIVSTPHLVMKFLIDSRSRGKGVETLQVDQKTPRECYVASLRIPPSAPNRWLEVHHVTILNYLDLRPNDEPRVC